MRKRTAIKVRLEVFASTAVDPSYRMGLDLTDQQWTIIEPLCEEQRRPDGLGARGATRVRQPREAGFMGAFLTGAAFETLCIERRSMCTN